MRVLEELIEVVVSGLVSPAVSSASVKRKAKSALIGGNLLCVLRWVSLETIRAIEVLYCSRDFFVGTSDVWIFGLIWLVWCGM